MTHNNEPQKHFLVSAASPSMDHKHGTVCQLNSTLDMTLYSFKRHLKAHLFQQYSTLLLAAGLSTARPASLWLFSEFGANYKYSDLLTYRHLNRKQLDVHSESATDPLASHAALTFAFWTQIIATLLGNHFFYSCPFYFGVLILLVWLTEEGGGSGL